MEQENYKFVSNLQETRDQKQVAEQGCSSLKFSESTTVCKGFQLHTAREREHELVTRCPSQQLL